MTNEQFAVCSDCFYRDDQRFPYADHFAPEVWLEDRETVHGSLIPVSAGPAICPRRNVVLLLASMMVAALLAAQQIYLQPPNSLDAHRPLPRTLNNYGLRLKFEPHVA